MTDPISHRNELIAEILLRERGGFTQLITPDLREALKEDRASTTDEITVTTTFQTRDKRVFECAEKARAHARYLYLVDALEQAYGTDFLAAMAENPEPALSILYEVSKYKRSGA